MPHAHVAVRRCGAGIGKALAKRLAAQGLNVVLVALGDDLLDQTAQELGELHPQVTFKKASALEGRQGAAGSGSVPGHAPSPSVNVMGRCCSLSATWLQQRR